MSNSADQDQLASSTDLDREPIVVVLLFFLFFVFLFFLLLFLIYYFESIKTYICIYIYRSTSV